MADVALPLPVPEPFEAGAKRKRPGSRSPTPPPATRARRSPEPFERITLDIPTIVDADPERRRERERQLALRIAEKDLDGPVAKPAPLDFKSEMAKNALTRTGGAYIPPARLRAMMAEVEIENHPGSETYQRMRWDALRKSLNGLINKVNVANIKYIVPELFGENLIRGRGLFCRSVMRAQSSSLPFTPIFAALVAIINTKLPRLGALLLSRLILSFRRAYRRNDKVTCIATTHFIGQLFNQRVASELLVLQILSMLLDRATDDSVEIAVGFMREVGALLASGSPRINNGIFEMFRNILHGDQINKRSQYMVEVLFAVRREKFKDNPTIPEGLDLVEEDDMITHDIVLDDDSLKADEGLNVFKMDPHFEQTEEEYADFKKEVLGDSDDESGDAAGSDDDSDDDEADVPADGIGDTVDIHDFTGTNLVNFRRRVYLTIMSSADFEEAVHKLLKMPTPEGQEIELCNMIVECCSQERTFSKFYGFIGERLCKLREVYSVSFDQSYRTYFDTIHRYETNRLRNIARFFGHLIATDAVSWTIFDVVSMTEDDTTSSSRIFIKILFQELVEQMGMPTLKARFAEPTLQMAFQRMFPVDNPKNTRFAINFWTSIGLGIITERMREHLKNAPALIMQQRQALAAGDDSSSSSDSSSDISSSSYDSEEDRRPSSRRPKSISRSPPRRRYEESPPRRRRYEESPPPRRRYEESPPPRRRYEESPPPRRRYEDSPPPRRRYEDSPPPRRRYEDSPPPRRRYEDSPPPQRRYEEDSPPPRRRRGEESPARYVSPPRDSTRPTNGRGHERSPSRSPPPQRSASRPPSPPLASRPRADGRARAADYLD